MPRWVKPILIVLLLVGLVLAYRHPAISALIQKDRLLAGAERLRQNPFAAVLVPLVFVGLCMILVPVMLLRTTTVLAFGPILGPIYALVGGVIAAFLGHELGRRAAGGWLQKKAGPRVDKIKALIDKGGVWAVCAMRLVPLGPYTVVNVACGAAGIRRSHFLIGTLLVGIPGVILVAIVTYVLE